MCGAGSYIWTLLNMKNLVFRFYLTVTICCQCGIAERSANGYFYDKPEGTLFHESAGTLQLLNSVPQFPPTGGYYHQQFVPSGPVAAEVEIVPSNLVYEDSLADDVHNGGPGGFHQQIRGNIESPPDFAQPHQIYRGPGGGNYQPIAFNVQDESQRPCASEPIVAQFHPNLVDLSNGGSLTRMITSCGPNEDCNSIRLQSNVNRHLGALSEQRNGGHNDFANAQAYQFNTARPRSSGFNRQADESLLVRPPRRRLFQYTEIERDDPFN